MVLRVNREPWYFLWLVGEFLKVGLAKRGGKKNGFYERSSLV